MGSAEASPNAAAIRSVLAELDDRQARALLIERLTDEADREAEAQAGREAGLGETITTGAGALGLFFATLAAALTIGGAAAYAAHRAPPDEASRRALGDGARNGGAAVLRQTDAPPFRAPGLAGGDRGAVHLGRAGGQRLAERGDRGGSRSACSWRTGC